MGIRLYTGVGEKTFNKHEVYTGEYACVSPVSGASTRTKRVNSVRVPSGAKVLQDSGAFSDGPGDRLTYGDALERQYVHADTYGYADQVTAIASYDCLLIDEIWEHGKRRKERWPDEAGMQAVTVSIDAARYLNRHRSGISLVLSAQGVTPTQYMKCSQGIVPLLEPGDIFGLGGWCIIGKKPAQMMPVFREAIHQVIPFLGKEQVKRVHIWGVCYAPALGELLYLCDQYGIELSTDSVGPTLKPVRGVWGYAGWRLPDAEYLRPPVLDSCGNCPEGTFCRGLERARHVRETREWLEHFREREPHCYKSMREKEFVKQERLFV